MTTTKKTAPKLSKDLQTSLDSMTTKSAKIRFLSADGMSRADIARTLDIRYQHVRNVLITPVKTPQV